MTLMRRWWVQCHIGNTARVLAAIWSTVQLYRVTVQYNLGTWAVLCQFNAFYKFLQYIYIYYIYLIHLNTFFYNAIWESIVLHLMNQQTSISLDLCPGNGWSPCSALGTPCRRSIRPLSSLSEGLGWTCTLSLPEFENTIWGQVCFWLGLFQSRTYQTETCNIFKRNSRGDDSALPAVFGVDDLCPERPSNCTKDVAKYEVVIPKLMPFVSQQCKVSSPRELVMWRTFGAFGKVGSAALWCSPSASLCKSRQLVEPTSLDRHIVNKKLSNNNI